DRGARQAHSRPEAGAGRVRDRHERPRPARTSAWRGLRARGQGGQVMGDAREPKRRRARAEVHASIDEQRGVFMISVAAELADMHPQTLRMYEQRGLITPKRSPKNTRLYSFDDVERLRRIQRMTADEGLNLAGVETVLDLERQLERARRELGRVRE